MMQRKYQLHGPDGKLLPPIDVNKVAIMAAAGLVNADTLLFDVASQSMVRAEEVPGLMDKIAKGQENPRAALLEHSSGRKRPPYAGVVFGVIVVAAILNFAGVRIFSRVRGTAAMATNAGIPAVLANSALAQTPEDLRIVQPDNKRVVPLPAVTRVRVLNQEGAIAQIRVTDPGANFNLTGYVHTANLRTEDGQKPYDAYFAPKAPGK